MTDVVVYYHDPIKTPLLRDAVLPALTAAEHAFPGTVGHVERHWLHGPHIRVRLDGPSADAAAVRVASDLRSYLAAHPSAVEISADDQLAHARSAAVAELLLPPFEPLYANNSVRIEPTSYARLRDLLGSDELISLRATGLRLGVPALRESLGVPAVELALTAMAVHASRFPPGLRYGYHSFLSHVEDFLLASDPDGVVRRKLDAVWERNADAACELVSRVADGHPTNALEAAWQTWTIGMRLAAEPSYDHGELGAGLNLPLGERAYEIGDEAAIKRYNYGERDRFSEYHTQLWTIDVEQPAIRRPLTVYRFGTNVLYQLLAILDVTPMERYAAAHMLAQAAQKVTGVHWSAQFAAMAG